MLRRFLLFMLVVLGLGSAARATSRKTADLSLVEPSGANASGIRKHMFLLGLLAMTVVSRFLI